MKWMIGILISLTYCLSAVAGDNSQFRTIGFSADGTYFAYAEVGVQDGSGFSYANVRVIKTQNSFLVAEIKEVIEEYDPSEGEEKDPLKIALERLDLSKYGITPDVFQYDLLVRLDTDHSKYESAEFSLEDTPLFNHPTHKLELTEKVVSEAPSFCSEYGMNRGVEVKLLTKDGDQTREFFLSYGLDMPSYCGGNYSLARVSYHPESNSLAVIIRYQRPGFEGPDSRYMAVGTNQQH